MKNFIFIIGLFFSICSNAFAEEAPKYLSLQDAENIALTNHPQIISAGYNVKIAKEKITISRSAYLPQINGNAVRTFADANSRIAATNGINNPTVIERGSIGVGVSQLITDFGKTSNLIDASKYELKAEKENADATCAAVLLQVDRAYYNLLRAYALQKVANDDLESRQKMLEQISVLRDAKMKSDLDLSLAKQIVGEAQLLKAKAESGLNEAEATFSAALGYDEVKKFKLDDNVQLSAPPSDLKPLIQTALNSNPELAYIANKKAAAKKLETANNRSSYPTVSAIGYAGNTPFRTADQKIDPNYAVAGINVSIPFFTGGRISAQQESSSYQTKIEEENLAAKENQLSRDVTIAFNNVRNDFENIDLADQILENANKTYDLTKTRYKIGKSSIVDLSQAQLARTQAEITVANAKYEYLIAKSVLESEVGEGELLNSCSKKML